MAERFCPVCNQRLIRRENEKPWHFKRRKLCSSKCVPLYAAKFCVKSRMDKNCRHCGKKIILPKSQLHRPGYLKHRAYCSAQCSGEAKKVYTTKPCEYCGKSFMEDHPNHRFCSKPCMRKAAGDKCNYKMVSRPNGERGTINVARAVMQKHLGRLLTTDEIVHHIDGDTRNDNLENLEVLSRKEHAATHKATRAKA